MAMKYQKQQQHKVKYLGARKRPAGHFLDADHGHPPRALLLRYVVEGPHVQLKQILDAHGYTQAKVCVTATYGTTLLTLSCNVHHTSLHIDGHSHPVARGWPRTDPYAPHEERDRQSSRDDVGVVQLVYDDRNIAQLGCSERDLISKGTQKHCKIIRVHAGLEWVEQCGAIHGRNTTCR